MEFGTATSSDREAVLDLLTLWYNDRWFFARYNQYDPAFRDELCLVARDRDRIVATAQIFDRTIRLAGSRVRAGGIGSVFTHPDYRNRGIASRLMRLAIDTLERHGFEVSMLFTDKLDFYARFGWRSVSRPLTILTAAGDVSPKSSFDVRAFRLETDLPAVQLLHEQYSGRFDTTVVRDGPSWRANLSYAGNPGECFVLAHDADAKGAPPLAYARAIPYYGFPMIMEFGYGANRRDAVVELFKYFVSIVRGTAVHSDRAGIGRAREILIPFDDGSPSSILLTHTAHDPELEAALAEAGFTLSYHRDENYMWRTVNELRLAERFGWRAEEVAQRLFSIVSSPTALFWTSDRF